MKPSGTDYLSEIPNTWDAKRMKFCAEICNGSEYADIVVDEGGFPVMGSGGEFARASKYCYTEKSVLLGRKGTIDKPLFIEEPFWCVDTMFYTKMNKEINAKYLYYCSLNIRFEYYVTSTALPSMTQRDLGSEKIAIPPLREQDVIADFLDKQCEKIDSTVTDIEKQIELLQKYKKSLITEAVTKGLDKLVSMKDSGMEWIGEVPEHWTIEPMKYRTNFYNGDRGENYPSKSEMVSEGVPFINAGHLLDGGLDIPNMDYITQEKYKVMGGVKLQKDDILYCLRGSIGKNSIVGINEGTVASSLVAIRSGKIVAKYLYYSMNSNIEEVQRFLWDNGTAQPNLSAENLSKFKVCLPPIKEQTKITNYLDNQCSKIDSIIERKKEQLTKITQHKKSLIYEYVTGKKRVKGANSNGN